MINMAVRALVVSSRGSSSSGSGGSGGSGGDSNIRITGMMKPTW